MITNKSVRAHPGEYILESTSRGVHPGEYISGSTSRGVHPGQYVPESTTRGVHPVRDIYISFCNENDVPFTLIAVLVRK